MRLITKTIWRAFPELDRFDDGQCQRFVNAANRRLSVRLVRRGLMGLVFLIVFGSPVWAALVEALLIYMGVAQRSWVLPRVMSVRSTRNDLAVAALLVGLPALAAFCAAVTRDWLLRRRVRVVLRTRGRCAVCHYFLAGLPVSAECVVVCPECGHRTEVDASLGELQAPGSGGGQGVFTPSEQLVRESDPLLTYRWLWRWTKRAAAALAALLLLAGVWWGWHEWRIHRQATRALSQKPGADALIDMMERAQRADVKSDAVNGFDLIAPLAKKMNRTQAELYPEGLPLLEGVNLSLGGELVAPRPYPGEPEQRRKDRLANHAYSAALLAELEKRGVFADMRVIVDAPLAIGSVNLTPGQPLYSVLLGDYATFRQFARWNGGRMRTAVLEDDPAKFAETFDLTLGLARMLERQPVLIGRLVAQAIEALAYGELRAMLRERNDARWLDAVEKAWKKYERHEPPSLSMEGERVFAKDMVCWIFADPARTRLGKYSPGLRQALTNVNGGTGPLPPGRLGSLEENLAEIDAFYDTLLADANQPRWQRKPFTPPQGELMLPMVLLPTTEHSLRSFDQIMIDRAAIPLLIALERYKVDKGEYPASLAELSPRWVGTDVKPGELPVDPWSGKPFGYKRLDASKDEQKRGFLLYAFGDDRLDNGGTPGSQPWEALQQPYNTFGFDYIINDEKR